MLELALHVLDILQNAVEAGAGHVELTIEEDVTADRLTIVIQDDGRGMDAETAARAIDPFYTSRTTRHVGLGLPLFAEAAEQAGGGLTIRSQLGQGTTVTATFQCSHPDRQPLGDIAATLLAFLLSPRAVELRYTHRIVTDQVSPTGRNLACDDSDNLIRDDDGTFSFDSADLRRELGDIPLTHPLVTDWLRGFLTEGESFLLGER